MSNLRHSKGRSPDIESTCQRTEPRLSKIYYHINLGLKISQKSFNWLLLDFASSKIFYWSNFPGLFSTLFQELFLALFRRVPLALFRNWLFGITKCPVKALYSHPRNKCAIYFWDPGKILVCVGSFWFRPRALRTFKERLISDPFVFLTISEETAFL